MNALARLLSAPRAAALAAAFFAAAAHAAPGDLDTSFSTNGIRTLPGPSESSAARATALAVQPDGRIVVGVKDAGASALARLDAAGTRDIGFGYNAWATRGERADFRALVIQPDGGILANPTVSNFTLDRYTSAGLIDHAFGTNGRVTDSSFFWTPTNTAAFALQPDGKVLITGMSTTGDFLIARYHADGTLDTDFGTNGKTTTDFGDDDIAFALALQPDGKIIVAGASDDDVALARYHADGAPDTSFGTGGWVKTDLGGTDRAYALAVQSDGRIVVAGLSGNDVALARYTADGALDPSFGAGGQVVTNFGGTDYAYALVLQPDGKPLVAVNNALGDFILARYTADGALDTSFGTAGIVTTDIACGGAGSTDRAHTLALQADGKILVAGETEGGFCYGDGQWVLARYQNDPFDLTPDALAFAAWANQDLGAVVASNAITVSGLDAGLSVPVAVRGGEYAVNGGAWTAHTGWVRNGDTLRVRHTAATTHATATKTVLSVGGLRAPHNSATLLGAIDVTFTSTTHGAPLAQDDSATTPRGTPKVISVLANDTDPDADPLAIGAFDALSFQGGAVADNGDGTLTYTPPAGFTGIDTFAYTVSDNRGGSDRATVTVTVTPVNDAPVAGGLTLAAYEGSAVSGTLPASDANADALTFAIVANGANGVAVITNAATGAFTYTPSAGATGADSFTFKATDSHGLDSTSATVTITINPLPLPANFAPVASNASLVTYAGSPISGVLAASDANGDALTFSIVTNGAKGTATINAATGAFTYAPNSGEVGTDSFTFQANDGVRDSNLATVSITINALPAPGNAAPVASGLALIAYEGSPVTGTLPAADANGDALTFSLIATSTQGTVVITDPATGAFHYTPNAGAGGTDRFTFQVSDGALLSAPATVSIAILAAPAPEQPAAQRTGGGGGALSPLAALLLGLAGVARSRRRRAAG